MDTLYVDLLLFHLPLPTFLLMKLAVTLFSALGTRQISVPRASPGGSKLIHCCSS